MSDTNYNHKPASDALRDGGTAAILSIGDLKGGLNIPASWTSQEVDGATAVGFVLDTTAALSTDLSKLFSIRNYGDEYLNVRLGTDIYGDSGVVLVGFNDDSGTPYMDISMNGGWTVLQSLGTLELISSSDGLHGAGYVESFVDVANNQVQVSAYNDTSTNESELVLNPATGATISAGPLGASEWVFGPDGSTTIPGAHYIHRQDASLRMVIGAANSLRTIILAHVADGVEHFHGGVASPDTVNFTAMPDACVDLATAETLIAYMLTGYALHDADAKAVGGGTYHNAQYAGSDLTSAAAPTTLAECLARLVDLVAKYNAHDFDADAHTDGELHQEGREVYSYSTVRRDYIVELSDTVMTPIVVLSTADCVDGRVIIVKDTSGGANGSNIFVTTEGAELIDLEGTYKIDVNFGSLMFYSDGATWHILISDPQVAPM